MHSRPSEPRYPLQTECPAQIPDPWSIPTIRAAWYTKIARKQNPVPDPWINSVDSFLGFSNPYLGILTYLIAPAFLVAGLVLIAVGAWRERAPAAPDEAGRGPRYPRLDLNVPRQRRAFIGVSVATFVFLMLTALGSYRTYEFTESVAFCGATCHTVMQPEYTAYQESPHARVACVAVPHRPRRQLVREVQALRRLSGVRHDRRPVPAPHSDADQEPAPGPARPASSATGRGSSTARPSGCIPHYLSDEHNSPWTIRLLLHDRRRRSGLRPGRRHPLAHEHREPDRVRRHRQPAPGHPVGAPDRRPRPGHRVPVHRRARSPRRSSPPRGRGPWTASTATTGRRTSTTRPATSVNLAISTGRIDSTLPFIKRQAVRALTGQYATTADALARHRHQPGRVLRLRVSGTGGHGGARIRQASRGSAEPSTRTISSRG